MWPEGWRANFQNRVLQPFLSVTFSARGNKVLKGDMEYYSASEDNGDHKHSVRSDIIVVCPFLICHVFCGPGRWGEAFREGTVSAVGTARSMDVILYDEKRDWWKARVIPKSRRVYRIWLSGDARSSDLISLFYMMDQRISFINCTMKVFVRTLPKSTEDVSGVVRIISTFFYIELI